MTLIPVHQPLNLRLPQVPVFKTDPDGSSPKSKYIMGRRNWCSAKWDPRTGGLVFDIRVEKQKGVGQTVGCVLPSADVRMQLTNRVRRQVRCHVASAAMELMRVRAGVYYYGLLQGEYNKIIVGGF